MAEKIQKAFSAKFRKNKQADADEKEAMARELAAAEVVPVVKIDGRKIGTGRPGKNSKAFMQAYHALTNASGAEIL